ncbi:MAG: competence type IV pilus minor pilin ComGF [Mesobacillus sp.]|uniref:competence type IV pilus minor pilin ComGF n=1 Tax=Mesobacillus sp. TaxID=2675271 RepID=UPI003C69E3C2
MLARIKKRMRNVPSLNDRGFTFLEMLLSLLTFLLIASVLPVGMRVILDDGMVESGIRRMEWEIFRSQVKKEVRSADEMTVNPEKIMMKIDGKVILYEKYGTSMRRRVDFQGHEILMQNLSSFRFERIEEGFRMTASDLNGVQHSAKFQNYIKVGEVSP